jgi:hypothetical protein
MPTNFKILILSLFNRSLTLKKIPDKWKYSMIQMIPKKTGSPSNINNYRPISMTSSIAKLFERILSTRIKAHLKSNNILVRNQSGFRNHRQTKDNLLYLTQKTTESFNRSKNVCAIFFDIQSAFDKVWHEGLIFKLIQINLPLYLVEIIHDYLVSRKFVVSINGHCSETKIIAAGVPQGAVLSSILFNIFINDLPTDHK